MGPLVALVLVLAAACGAQAATPAYRANEKTTWLALADKASPTSYLQFMKRTLVVTGAKPKANSTTYTNLLLYWAFPLKNGTVYNMRFKVPNNKIKYSATRSGNTLKVNLYAAVKKLKGNRVPYIHAFNGDPYYPYTTYQNVVIDLKLTGKLLYQRLPKLAVQEFSPKGKTTYDQTVGYEYFDVKINKMLIAVGTVTRSLVQPALWQSVSSTGSADYGRLPIDPATGEFPWPWPYQYPPYDPPTL